MKTFFWKFLREPALVGIAWLVFAPSLSAQSDPVLTQPAITSVAKSGEDILVHVSVPEGARRITLESRARLEPGAWTPRAVRHLDGTEETVSFRLAASESLEILRVRADATDPLPASFYTGTNVFAGEPTVSESPGPGMVRTTTFNDASSQDGASPEATARDVVESDLWKIAGDTLYFFNQYRGLQIIDITDPEAPAVRGQLSMPAAGEQMYLLDSGEVILLARSGCYFSNSDQSEVLVVGADENDVPRVVARVSVPGYIQESRLVGGALYVASQTYRVSATPDGSVWEYGLALSSFDLSDPSAPVARETLWFAGYGGVVSATERFFFVVTHDPSDWRQSIVHTVDISNPDGSMAALHTLRPAGRVTDKFKLNVRGDVFTVISQVQTTTLYTELETFSLEDPAHPRKLGELSLGRSERLHATRFAGDRVYVVTFFVPLLLDPLFVVDLSDPARPAIEGELEIPGFSTFLHPRGNQLVALGIETNRTTVSLFDVADPAQPSLLSRVQIGDGWSWSEANWDEKAFKVLEEEGLILLPFQSWTENRYVQRVQLIDLLESSLVARGAIDHEFAPRRATVHRDRILSLSGRELLSVDATDRDQPEVVASTELAWPVDRVFAHEDFLIELETGRQWWSESQAPMIRVARADWPDAVLGRFALANPMPVTGATVRHDRLYVTQGPSHYFPVRILAESTGQEGDETEETEREPNFFLTVIDLGRLPELEVIGQTETVVSGYASGSWEAVWPREDLVVWAGGGQSFWWWGWEDAAVPTTGGALATDALIAWPPYYGGGGGQLLAFNVGAGDDPRFVSELNLSTNTWWNFSRPFTANGLVYLSHQATEFVEDLDVANLTTTYDQRRGTWVQRYFLDVVDYTDAAEPMRRRPVNIPGQLQGIARSGALLYTLGYHFDRRTGQTDWTEFLDASAYDGIDAHWVDSLALPRTWPHPVLVDEDSGMVYLGSPATNYYATPPAEPSYLETWRLSDGGEFTRLGQIMTATPVSQLAKFGGLLAARENDNSVRLFDVTQGENPVEVGSGRPPGCVWFDLEKADGGLSRGLWVPLGIYGAAHISIAP